MRECIPPNLHDPQRAKGSLDRRSKWFSLVPFFLQKKKGTRAGARNAPSRARRQCPPNTTAASAATYPLRCSAPQWARFDNRHSTSAPTPTLTAVSGSGASGTSDPPNRQCYPPHFMRECIPPNLHDPQRAKGSLDRRSKRLSFPHFFLRRKKCGRRRLAPAGATPAHSRAKEVLKRSFKRLSLVAFFQR